MGTRGRVETGAESGLGLPWPPCANRGKEPSWGTEVTLVSVAGLAWARLLVGGWGLRGEPNCRGGGLQGWSSADLLKSWVLGREHGQLGPTEVWAQATR